MTRGGAPDRSDASGPAPGVVVACRDDGTRGALAEAFGEAGVACRHAASLDEARDAIAEGACDVAVLELALSAAGPAAVAELLEGAPGLGVVALVGADETALGVQAVRLGAVDFLRAPLDAGEVRHVLAKSLRLVEACEAEPPPSLRLAPEQKMVGASPAIVELERTLRRAAGTLATVLVRGETGSGKDVVARRLHEKSARSRGPFVKVHCAALPDNLLESELFGYEKGAFTGAVARKPGRVELAQGGTLFLDEIGDITPALQVKLLRVLQEKEYEPLGSTRTQSADVRFVAATHRDLESLVAKGEFREDLFYRLNVVSLWVPPLRERPGDIEPLALHFCAKLAEANGRGALVFDVVALDLLRGQPWPGNVRQLQNFVERVVVLATGPRIGAADVERELKRQSGPMGLAVASGYVPPLSKESSLKDLNAALKQAERRALEKALRAASGNRTVAARLLGISVRSLYYKLEEHGLSRPAPK